MSAIQRLLDDKAFWEGQALEFEAHVLDLVAITGSDDAIRFTSRLYLQHMRGIIYSRFSKYEDTSDAAK